ncbi:hypothetical protein ACFXPX_04565 [Kitasatospora sp. NPDC059146]|uniref:hypothetical protein n=1 Tax=unclassified Kitasatospora TaxID=2633591 RepID=UPI00368C8090
MTTSRGSSLLLARARAWGGDPRRAGRRLLAWLLLAVPVGVLAGRSAREVSRLIGQAAVLDLPWPLALFPGLLLLLMALSARGVHETWRPPVGEVLWFVTVAGLISLSALA